MDSIKALYERYDYDYLPFCEKHGVKPVGMRDDGWLEQLHKWEMEEKTNKIETKTEKETKTETYFVEIESDIIKKVELKIEYDETLIDEDTFNTLIYPALFSIESNVKADFSKE